MRKKAEPKRKLTQAYIHSRKPEAEEYSIRDSDVKGLSVRILPGGTKSFILRYTGSDGKARRETIGEFKEPYSQATDKISIEQARTKAEVLRASATEGTDIKAPDVPTLEEGISQGLFLARARKSTRDGYKMFADWFVAWIGENFPRVRTWEDLRPMMLEQYVRELENNGASWDTIRLRISFIRTVWRRMAVNYPGQVLPLPPRQELLPKKPRGEITCLEPAQVARLLEWLKVNRKGLYPMACLQGLAGLRGLEAACLRVEDVDFKAGTITITDTGRHVPKNEFSERTIPVCGEVLEALKTATGGKVKIVRGEIFHDADGKPWGRELASGALDFGALSRAWRRAFKAMAANPVKVDRGVRGVCEFHSDGLGDPIFKGIPARKLRASFMTMASRLGAQDRILKAYAGHAPEDILGRHYRAIGLDELKQVSALMEHWRGLIEVKDQGKAETAIGGE